MSNEVAKIDNMSLEEMMGISTGVQSGPSVARLRQVQEPVMGEVEVNGKKPKTETIPVGAYKLVLADDTEVYAHDISVRVFAARQQWQRWDSEAKTTQKTVMASNLNQDLKDTMGGFNLGRPSGYIKDFQALPEKTKELIRSLNRVRIVMGVATVETPLGEDGEPLENVEVKDVPFVMEIKNRDSLTSLDDAFKTLGRKNILPILGVLSFKGETKETDSGKVYAIMDVSVSATVEMAEEDKALLRDFMDYIEYVNGYVLHKWSENNTETLSPDDADLVGSLVNVEAAGQ